MMLFSTGLGWSVLGSLSRNLGCCWAGLQALASLSSTKTRKKKGWRGLRPWPLRCLSQFFPTRKDRLLKVRMFFVYLSPRGWPDIYSVCFFGWMVIRILSHWMRYYLSISALIRDIEGAVYRELPFFFLVFAEESNVRACRPAQQQLKFWPNDPNTLQPSPVEKSIRHFRPGKEAEDLCFTRISRIGPRLSGPRPGWGI